VRWEQLEASRCEVDEVLKSRLFAYMEVMHMNYAAFDIAISREGECIFLESNECGQFLYLEEVDPSIPMLDAFCKYLSSGDPNFSYQGENKRLSLADFEASLDAAKFHEERITFEKRSSKLSPFELQE
jgi:hypothetical protein